MIPVFNSLIIFFLFTSIYSVLATDLFSGNRRSRAVAAVAAGAAGETIVFVVAVSSLIFAVVVQVGGGVLVSSSLVGVR